MSFRLACPNHPRAPIIDTVRDGDRVCSQCGLVLDRVINEGEDWRSFSNSEKSGGANDPSRVGEVGDRLLPGSELKTFVSAIPGANLSWANWHAPGSQSASKSKSLQAAFRYLGQLCTRLSLAEIFLTQAKQRYKLVDDTQQVKGRSHEVIAATCLYMVCKERGSPRSLKEICAASEFEKKQISRCLKKITAIIGSTHGITRPEQLVNRYCSDLNLRLDVTRAAEHIAKIAGELNLSPGRSPISMCAASIYLASLVSSNPQDLRTVANGTGASESTIRSVYCDLYPAKEYLFPRDFNFKSRLADVPNYGPPKEIVSFVARATELGITPVAGEPIKDEPKS